MKKLLIALVALVALSACNVLNGSAENQLGRRYLDEIRTGDPDVSKHLDPEIAAQLTPDVFARVRAVFPAEQPRSVKMLGFRNVTSSNLSTYSSTFEYEFSKQWVYAEIVLRRHGNGEPLLAGFHVTPMQQSLEAANKFSLTGKPAVYDLFVALVAAMACFTIGTAIVCWRTPVPRRKWLWIIFILIAFCRISLNWTTGHIFFEPFTFVLFGAGFMQVNLGPMMFQLGVPVGAIIFWIRRGKWIRKAHEEQIGVFGDGQPSP
jgi:hypothetical protein